MARKNRIEHLALVRPPGAADLECPLCGRSDKTEKASSVVRQNSGTVLLANSNLPSSFVTTLGSQLSRPQAPHRARWPSAVKGIAISLIVAILVFGAVKILRTAVTIPSAGELGVIVSLVCFGAIIPAFILARTYVSRLGYAEKADRWRTADARWSKLYYCARDDACFIDGEDEACSPEDVSELLYPPPASVAANNADLVQVPV